jgi:hypothetical protein
LITVAALLPAMVFASCGPERGFFPITILHGPIWLLSAPWRSSANRLSRSSRAARQRIEIVAGGPLFTAEPDPSGGGSSGFGRSRDDPAGFYCGSAKWCPQKIYRADGYPDIHQTPIPLWDLIQYKTLCLLEHSVFQRVPFQLRFLQYHQNYSAAGRAPKHRSRSLRSWIHLSDRLARQYLFCGRQFYRQQTGYLKKQLLPALIEWRRDKNGMRFFY